MEDSLEQTNLDSTKFDSRKYLTNFLQTNNLNQLIQKNNELHQSIRSCDHDIQNLVFENYQKFLTSIDTVKKMKGSINKVEQRIQNLSTNMSKINNLASNIHDALSTKHEAIQELDIVRRDLARLKKVCEFPAVLKQELEKKEDFSRSVEFYQECMPLIDNFKNEALIKGIYRDVIECLNEIRFILFKRQKDEPNLKEQKQILKSLVVIQEDQELVIKTYIKGIKDSISDEIKKHSLHQRLSDKQQQSKPKPTTDTSALTLYLEEHSYQQSFEELQVKKAELSQGQQQNKQSSEDTFALISKIISKLVEETRFLLQDLLAIIKLSEERKAKQREELNLPLQNLKDYSIVKQLQSLTESMIKETISLILEEMSKRIVAGFNERGIVSNEGIMEVYRELREELQEIFELNVSQELRTGVSDKVMTNMQDVFLKQVYSEFAQLKISTIKLVILIKEKCIAIDQNTLQQGQELTQEEEYTATKKAMFSLLTEFKNRFYTLLSVCLLELKPLSATSTNQSEIYIHQELSQQITAQFMESLKFLLQIVSLDPNKLSYEWVQQIGLTATMAATSSQGYAQSSQLYLVTEKLLLELAGTPGKETVFSPFFQIIKLSQYFILMNHFLLSCSQGSVFGKCSELLGKIFVGMESNNNSVPQLESEIPRIYIPGNLFNYLGFRTQSFLDFQGIVNNSNGVMTKMLKFFYTELILLFPSGKKFLLSKKPSILSRSENTEMEKMLAKKSHHLNLQTTLDANQCITSIFKGILKAELQNVRNLKWIMQKEAEEKLINTAFVAQIALESVQVDEEPVIVGLLFEVLASLEDKVEGVQGKDKIRIKVVEDAVVAARNSIKSF